MVRKIEELIKTEFARQVRQIIREELGVIRRLLESRSRLSSRAAAIWALPPTPYQESVFQAIEAIEGRGAAARKKAQRELRKLEGQRAMEQLVNRLKSVLKRRGRGLKCPKCGDSSAPVWQKGALYTAGGCLRYQHRLQSGSYTKHGTETRMGRFPIVGRSGAGRKPKAARKRARRSGRPRL